MRALVLGAALAFVANSAFAADDIMANYYGNTVVSKSSAGRVAYAL